MSYQSRLTAWSKYLYTETIDWNLNIDPALVKEVDREYFTHDAEERKGNIG